MNPTPDLLFPRLVHDDLLRRVRALSADRDARLAALRTRADALRYCAHAKRTIRQCFGPLPTRTPLNAVVTHRHVHPQFTLETVVIESRPRYPVTGNLYLPAGPMPRGGFPAVLGSCGHADDGKAAVPYQSFAQALARQGYVVFIYDPVGQGERHQYRQFKKLKAAPQRCVPEHCMIGKQLGMLGEFFGTWRAWDGIRALDYLLSRPEIDRTRVGVTGNSGGGTLTTYLNALDDRFTMAAPSCFVTTYLANLENELPADSEQCPPGIIGAGLDLGDFFIAQAPRPVILLGQTHDFFDIRGLKKTYAQIRRVYSLLGAARNVELFLGPDQHGYSQHNREAMYRFFHRFTHAATTAAEPKVALAKERDLFAAPRGHVAHWPRQRYIHDLLGDLGKQAKARRGSVKPAALPRRIATALHLSPRAGIPHFRVPRPDSAQVKPFDAVWRFAVETEPANPDVTCLLHAWDPRPLAARKPMVVPQCAASEILYVPHISSRADLHAGHYPLPIHKRLPLWTVDPRGLGVSRPGTCGRSDFFSAYDADYMYDAYHLMLGDSHFGRRVHDVLRTLDLMQAHGAQQIHLVGRGIGGLLATCAACVHPLVTRVTLKHVPRSFHELTQTPIVTWPQSALPWNVLNAFDLPDCWRLLQRKRLRVLEPWTALIRT